MYIPYLFDLYGAIFKSSVGDWGINSSRIRLRRDDDDFEKEFSSLSGSLDVASITDFNSWNMLDGSEYRDYLYDVPLGVDSDLDGISDGWTSTVGAGITMTPSTNGVQTFEITSSSTNNISSTYTEFSATVGDSLSVSVDVKTIGSIKAKIAIDWYNGGSFISSSSTSSTQYTDFTTVDITGITAPATTTKARMLIRYEPIIAGDAGTAYFKNAIAVKNDFIEDIGLLTEDDDSDGVANEWTYTANGFDGTVVKSVSDNGQKINITSGGTNTSDPFVFTTLGATDGNDLTLTIDLRVSGDVSGLLGITELPTNDSTFSALFTNTEWETKTLDVTIDDGDTSIDIKLRNSPNQVGSTGYVEYRNATLKQTNNSTYVSKVFDKSGNGNHAVQTTAGFQPRLINEGTGDDLSKFEVMSDGDYGMYFDGVDDRFDVTDSSGLDITTGDLSLLANFDPDNNGYIISRNLDTFNLSQYVIQYETGIVKFDLNGISARIDYTSNNQTIAVGTYNHTDSIIYEDSVLSDNVAFSDDLTSRPNVQIGCRSGSTDGITKAVFLTGHINRITVFNKALTQTEITYLTSKV